MNYSSFLIYVPLLALMLGYSFWMRRRVSSAMQNSRPAQVAFFERTGYRYHDLRDQSAEAQADRATQSSAELMALGKKQALGQSYDYETHQVRDYHGLRVHFHSGFGYEKKLTSSKSYQSAYWEADLVARPRVSLHVADKSLVSVLKGVGELVSNSRRVFKPRGSQRIATGIPALDQRVVVFGEDPAAVAQLFAENPALVELLSGWAELDVFVTSEGAVFNDPSQKNLQAAMGGMVGSMALGFDFAKRMELSIPVHDRVADLLLTLVRATS